MEKKAGTGKAVDKKGNLGGLFRYDLYRGICCQWKRLLLVFLLCAGSGIYLYAQTSRIAVHYHLQSGATFMDHLLHLLHGMEPYTAAPGRRFELPVTYLGIFACTSFLVGGYLREDLHGTGLQMAVRSRTRKDWVLSKILWNVAAVTTVYGVIVLTALLMSGGGLKPTAQLGRILMRFDAVGQSGLSDGQLFLLMLGGAYLTSLAVAQLQMAIEMIFSPMAGFIGVMGLVFLSAYITSPFLPGNYFMIQRNELFLEGGMQTGVGIAFNLTIIAVSVMADFYCFKKRDIL